MRKTLTVVIIEKLNRKFKADVSVITAFLTVEIQTI